MRIRSYTQLLKHVKHCTFYNVVNRRGLTENGYQNLQISPSVVEEVQTKVAEFLNVSFYDVERMPSWASDRMQIKASGVSYCAGQDYPAELRQIRKHIRNT